MNAILAMIADSGQVIIVIDRKGVEISSVLLSFIDPTNPLTAATSKLFRVGSRGWCTLIHQNHAAGGKNSSIMVGMFVCLCLASQKPS